MPASSTGRLATAMSSVITSWKLGLEALTDRMPVTSAGIPADLLVVEAWSKMQPIAPYLATVEPIFSRTPESDLHDTTS